MSVPMAPDSRVEKPMSLAVIAQPRNLPKKATAQMRMTYPHVIPSLSSPRLVLKPDRAKYWRSGQMSYAVKDLTNQPTRGMNTIQTRSSSFSTRAIAKPPS